jgi:predicted O-methyltransferase YrrM
MKRIAMLQYILDRLPYIGRLRKQVRAAGLYPAGHYYSPIPNHDELVGYLASTQTDQRDSPAIDLNRQHQFALLAAFQAFYDDLPFPETKSPACRYYYDQSFFCYADAIFLYSFLRHSTPRRIIEVGSGFSSAVILDTVERFFLQPPALTFIEPYPERLRGLLKSQDAGVTQIIESKVQAVPLETFQALRAGDLLFIDSTHVVKCGSDVQFLMFEVLPQLSPGVVVHFHDVFHPFEYPAEWLLKGIYWNEDYFLRAFLSYNSEWEIVFFNTYVATVFRDFLREKMPLCLKNTGGSLYIRRRGKG